MKFRSLAWVMAGWFVAAGLLPAQAPQSAPVPPSSSPWGALARMLSGPAPAPAASAAAAQPVAQPVSLPEVPNETPNAAPQPQPTASAPQVATIDPTAQAPLTGSVGALSGLALDRRSRGVEIDLGRESEDTNSLLASNLFKNPDIRRLLGDSPRFVYDPKDKPDPMLVPWVRRAAIFNELMTQAEALVAQGQVERAVPLFQRMLDLHDPRFTPLVRARLEALNAQQVKESERLAAVQASAQDAVKLELPNWVRENTTGVIVSPDDAVCLVGDFLLRRGDPIPAYPDVLVAAITPKSVTFRIKDKEFEVNLQAEAETAPATTAVRRPARR